VAETDQGDENGVVKSKRRTLRHSVRAASIMDIAVDIVDVDEDGAVEDTEVEATAEMANQNADVVAIEDVETHKQLCSNCIFADSKATGRIRLSLRCTKSYSRFAISVDAGQKFGSPSSFLGVSAQLGDKSGKLDVVAILCVCSSFFFLFLCNLYHQDHGHGTKKTRSYEYDRAFLVWVALQRSDLEIRTNGLDQNLRFLFCSLFARRFDTWVEEWIMHGVEWVE
jgi:hypothetical protein